MPDIATKAIIQSKNTPREGKIKLLEKELRSGKKEVFNGLKELKKAIQTPTDSFADIGKMAEKTREANKKINIGREKIFYARRQMHALKTKKYWK